MKTRKPYPWKRSCLFVPLGALAVLLVLALAFYIDNRSLPKHSTTLDQLTELDKARLSEAFHLRAALGEAAWPGFSQADIPMIVYNEKYAFLLGYPNPPAGWMKIPSMEQRGGAWEAVPGDSFSGQPYYRTLIPAPGVTPQSFTVLVGQQWVASLMTREYSQVDFYSGFRQDLPSFISNIFPTRLVWKFLMGKSEGYIGGLEHEAFHAFQGMQAHSQLFEAESMYDVAASYPYDEQKAAWFHEMDVLVQAAQASDDSAAIDLTRQFLDMRQSRRSSLSPEQIKLERLREWEEGLAKYAELEITRQAGAQNSYLPVESLSQDKDFHGYESQPAYWSEQLTEARNANLSGDTRFYYSGNAQAVLLDHLLPGWKSQALPGGEFLDVLLTEAIK
jgi:hypothetical protein